MVNDALNTDRLESDSIDFSPSQLGGLQVSKYLCTHDIDHNSATITRAHSAHAHTPHTQQKIIILLLCMCVHEVMT